METVIGRLVICRGAIDRNCETSPDFGLTQKIIAEIKFLSPIFCGCEVEDVRHLGEIPKGTKAFDATFCKRVKSIAPMFLSCCSGNGVKVEIISQCYVFSGGVHTLAVQFDGALFEVYLDGRLVDNDASLGYPAGARNG